MPRSQLKDHIAGEHLGCARHLCQGCGLTFTVGELALQHAGLTDHRVVLNGVGATAHCIVSLHVSNWVSGPSQRSQGPTHRDELLLLHRGRLCGGDAVEEGREAERTVGLTTANHINHSTNYEVGGKGGEYSAFQCLIEQSDVVFSVHAVPRTRAAFRQDLSRLCESLGDECGVPDHRL